MQPFEFLPARTLAELRDLMQIPGRQIIAGGTDLIPQIRNGKFRVNEIVDISAITELRFIHQVDGEIHIGSLVTFQDILLSPLLQEKTPILIQAGRSIGAPMTRSRATLGGNIANASPAADSLPPLFCLGAAVHLSGLQEDRTIPIEDFMAGPGKTILEQGEFIHSISFPLPPAGSGQAFLKLGPRRGMSISTVSAAACVALENQEIQAARIAIGAVAPVVRRCVEAENLLIGKFPAPDLWQTAAALAAAKASPISDIRGSKEYRQKTVEVLVRRVLTLADPQNPGGDHAKH
jgi:CO/xanthine dehydrogenase FAD-binding subunit